MADDNALDQLAVQRVMLRYAAGVDERDRPLYQSCFAPAVEVVGFGDKTIHGIEPWLNYVWKALEQYSQTQHMLAPSLMEIQGDAAEVRTDVQALHLLADGSERRFTLWATYKSRMTRTAGMWRICKHELVVRDSKLA